MTVIRIEPFVRALDATDLALDAREIAEALWLARFMPSSVASREVIPAAVPEEARQTEAEPRPTVATQVLTVPARASKLRVIESGIVEAATETDVFAVTQSLSNVRPLGHSVRLSGLYALDDRHGIAAALRPFARKRKSERDAVLDEAATVDAFAATDGQVLLPVMKRGTERWFDALMLVERVASTDLWSQHIAEFVQILVDQTAFRDVVQVGLAPDAAVPATLTDAQHTLVFVVSDCTSAAWSDGRMRTLMATISQRFPVTLLHLLPERLWERTAIARPGTRVSTIVPGVANARLDVALPWWDIDDIEGRTPLPVISLDAQRVASWAQSVMATGGARCDAIMVAQTLVESPAVGHRSPATLPTADERIARFARMVSPMARQLAASLSTAPLTLPVMRLVQRSMHPDSDAAHLAEVFLGGLIERVSSATENVRPDDVRYEFHEGVRERLWTWLDQHAAERLLVTVGQELAKRSGHNLDFDALLVGGDGQALPSGMRPFARIAGPLLERLGYGRSAASSKARPLIAVDSQWASAFPQAVQRMSWSSDGKRVAVTHDGGVGMSPATPDPSALEPLEPFSVCINHVAKAVDSRVYPSVLSFLTDELPITLRGHLGRAVDVYVGERVVGDGLMIYVVDDGGGNPDVSVVDEDDSPAETETAFEGPRKLREEPRLQPWAILLGGSSLDVPGPTLVTDLREYDNPHVVTGMERIRKSLGAAVKLTMREMKAGRRDQGSSAIAWSANTQMTALHAPFGANILFASSPWFIPTPYPIVAMTAVDGRPHVVVNAGGSVMTFNGSAWSVLQKDSGLRRRLFASSDRPEQFGYEHDDAVVVPQGRCELMPDALGDPVRLAGCTLYGVHDKQYADLLDDRGRVHRFWLDSPTAKAPIAISVAGNLDPLEELPDVTTPPSFRITVGASSPVDCTAFGTNNGWLWVSFPQIGGAWFAEDRNAEEEAIEAIEFSPDWTQLAVAAGPRVSVYRVDALRRAVLSHNTTQSDTGEHAVEAEPSGVAGDEAWVPRAEDIGPAIDVLQALALAFHVRTVFPDVDYNDDKALIAFFDLRSATDIADFQNVRMLCEWIYRGPVQDWFKGVDVFASLRLQIDEAIAIENASSSAADGLDERNRVRNRDYTLRRLYRNVRHLIDESDRSLLDGYVSNVIKTPESSMSGDEPDGIAAFAQALQDPRLVTILTPWLTSFHAQTWNFPSVLAHSRDMGSFLAVLADRWTTYLAEGMRHVSNRETTLVRVGYGIEPKPLRWMQETFPEVPLWPRDDDSDGSASTLEAPSPVLFDASRGLRMCLSDYQHVVGHLASGLARAVVRTLRVPT